MNAGPAAIMVAVGRDGSDAAVRFGAAESARLGRPLLLVHVAGTDAYAQQLGRDALTLASTRSRILAEPGCTATRLVVGSVLPVLAGLAATSHLVVTERREAGTVLRPSTSMTAAVAAATDVPVVSVPSGWIDEPRTGVVVTGFDSCADHPVALRSAVAESMARQATLLVVAATWRPPGSGTAELAQVDRPQERATRDVIALKVRAAGGERCEIAIDLADARAEDVLIEASSAAALIVVGRHRPLLRAGSRLGPVARAVLRGSACPVLLAAPESVHDLAVRVG